MRDVLVPGGLLALAMVEADLDDVPIDFLGGPIRVTGYPRDELAAVVTATGFEVLPVDHLLPACRAAFRLVICPDCGGSALRAPRARRRQPWIAPALWPTGTYLLSR